MANCRMASHGLSMRMGGIYLGAARTSDFTGRPRRRSRARGPKIDRELDMDRVKRITGDCQRTWILNLENQESHSSHMARAPHREP